MEKSSPTFKDHLDLNNRVTKLESENKTLFNEIRESFIFLFFPRTSAVL